MSTDLMTRAEEIMAKSFVPDRATYFQMKNFILGKEPTAQGQIWATIRAIEGKREEIDCLQDGIADQEDNIGMAEVHLDRIRSNQGGNDWEKREQVICLRKSERNLASLRKNLEKLKKKLGFVFDELKYYVAAYDALVGVVGEPRPMDDLEAQHNYWNQKLTEELNLSFLLKRPVSIDFVQTVLALDDSMPIKQQVLQILQNIQIQAVRQQQQLTEKAAQIAQVTGETKNNG